MTRSPDPRQHPGRDGNVVSLGWHGDAAVDLLIANTGPGQTGGLGKTRLAHRVGQLAEQPIIHFVDLTGATSAEGVAVEVSDALGICDPAPGTPPSAGARAADLVGRIVDQIGSLPVLLIPRYV